MASQFMGAAEAIAPFVIAVLAVILYVQGGALCEQWRGKRWRQ